MDEEVVLGLDASEGEEIICHTSASNAVFPITICMYAYLLQILDG